MSDSIDIRDPALVRDLSRLVGYCVPEPFRRLVERLGEILREEPGVSVRDVLGFELRTASSSRNFATPPELFAIGWTGVDGGHYGHLDRTPELPSDDLPFANFEPGTGEISIGPRGDDAHDTFRVLLQDGIDMSRIWDPKDEGGRVEFLLDVAERLGIYGVRDGTDKGNAVFTDAHEHHVEVPPGYSFIPTPDRVGVLAPSSSFHSSDPSAFPAFAVHPVTAREANVPAFLAQGRRHAAEHLGSALYFYKCAFEQMSLAANTTTPPDRREDLLEMARCYGRLGRPMLGVHALRSAGLKTDAEAMLRTIGSDR